MICLDACIIGHVIAPDISLVPVKEIEASKTLVNQIIENKLSACSTVILIAEVKWLISRVAKRKNIEDYLERVDEAESLLPQTLGRSFKFINVDFAIAALAADYRLEHYSKKNTFSYNDGIYLATASLTGCDALITTDSHLLAVSDVPVFTPSAFLARKNQ